MLHDRDDTELAIDLLETMVKHPLFVFVRFDRQLIVSR